MRKNPIPNPKIPPRKKKMNSRYFISSKPQTTVLRSPRLARWKAPGPEHSGQSIQVGVGRPNRCSSPR